MGRYATDTNVSAEKSKAEIEGVLMRYGAEGFMSGWDSSNAYIAFDVAGKRVRFILPLPDRQDEEFRYTPARRYRRSETDRFKAWEQACRQRWRALRLCIIAKLEAVECGITTFEDEFLAHIVMPNGRTVSEWVMPKIAEAYESRAMPPLGLPE